MENGEFKYNAFISYRHKDLDKFVAENLHRLIETYKMPKPVVEKYNITDKISHTHINTHPTRKQTTMSMSQNKQVNWRHERCRNIKHSTKYMFDVLEI